MNRFRFTLLAVCLVLLFLGGNDLLLWWQNQNPAEVSISDLETEGPPREWLDVTDGYQDLESAISTSGSIELEALLVPLRSSPAQTQVRVLLETRNPHLLELFKQYHFFSDTLPEKQAFLQKHGMEFRGQRDITGMLVSGLIAKGNRQKLIKLAKETGLDVSDEVIFLSEGKEPARWRGLFFTIVGLLGLVRFFSRKPTAGKHNNPKIGRQTSLQ
jgi:hypothetical protein